LSLRLKWSEQLVQAVSESDLVLLDQDNGIQGSRLSPKHVALSEIAALRRQDRALMFAQGTPDVARKSISSQINCAQSDASESSLSAFAWLRRGFTW
jgi:hypothetical protein